jgi:hypothetical protein
MLVLRSRKAPVQTAVMTALPLFPARKIATHYEFADQFAERSRMRRYLEAVATWGATRFIYSVSRLNSEISAESHVLEA